MSKREGWVQLPVEPAAPWLRLGAFARALGAELFRVWQEHPVAGVSMDTIEDVAVRMLSPDARERKALRAALRSIVDAGLIVACEGGVRLLYGRRTYAEHARMVHLRSTHGAPKVDVSSTDGAPMVPASSTDGAQTGEPKPSEPLDPPPHIDRDIERKISLLDARGHEEREIPKYQTVERPSRERAPWPICDEPEPEPEEPKFVFVRELAKGVSEARNDAFMPTGKELAVLEGLKRKLAASCARRAEPEHVLGPRVLANFFADPFAAAACFSVWHLERHWSRYVEPPVSSERAAELAQQRERESLQEALKRDRSESAQRLGVIPVKLFGGES